MRLTVSLLVLMPALAMPAAEPVAVHVTGHDLVVGDTAEIPSGLFGVHNVPLDNGRMEDWGVASSRIVRFKPGPQPAGFGGKRAPDGLDLLVECFYDRYHPALQLTNPDGWYQHLQQLGAGYAANASDPNRRYVVEFWNEPYLNWATKPGVNFDPHWYDQSQAQEGGPVHIRGQSEPVPGLEWRTRRWFEIVSGPHDFGAYVVQGNLAHRFRRLEPGDEFSHQRWTFRAVDRLVPTDTQQPQWWAGGVAKNWYVAMLRAFGEPLKAANPEVQLIAGWGFHMSQNNWQAWEVLGKPTVDETIDLIDGFHEHHYGGDPRMTAAQYLAINAYGRVQHGKHLDCYNTEAGANFDPQRPDQYLSGDEKWYARTIESVPLRTAHVHAAYLQRDILHLIDVCPDVAVARAAHHPHHDPGSPWGFRQLKALRGPMVATESADWQVWSVASRPSADAMTVVVWNDRRDATTVALSTAAPAGTTLAGVEAEVLAANPNGDGLALVAVDVGTAAGASHQADLTIPPRQAVVLRYALSGSAAPQRLERRRYPSGDIIIGASAEQAAATAITLPEAVVADVANASGVRLLLTQLGATGTGGETVTVNGHQRALPSGSWTIRVPIDAAWLQADNQLRFTTKGDWLGIWSVAIEIDHLRAP